MTRRIHFVTGKLHTVSQGIAEYNGEIHLDDFVARADKALYEAKTGGRNRIEMAT